MVAPHLPAHKAEGEGARIAPPDPRIAAFARLCKAIDFIDITRMLASQRELRGLGFSVVIIEPRGQGDGR